MQYKDFKTASVNLPNFREGRIPRGAHMDEHHEAALQFARTLYANDDLENAEVWALRALHDGPSCNAFMLLADICEGTDDLINARRWLQAAQRLGKTESRRYEPLITEEQIRARLIAVERLMRERWPARGNWLPLLTRENVFTSQRTLGEALERAAAENDGHAVYSPTAPHLPRYTRLRHMVPPELDAVVKTANICADWSRGLMDTTYAFKLPARALACAQIEWVVIGPVFAERLRKLDAAALAAIDAEPTLLAKHVKNWGTTHIRHNTAYMIPSARNADPA